MVYEDLFAKFDQLRAKRWDLVGGAVESTEHEVDELLADIANIVTILYISRQAQKQPTGFVSSDKRKR